MKGSYFALKNWNISNISFYFYSRRNLGTSELKIIYAYFYQEKILVFLWVSIQRVQNILASLHR